MWLEYLLRNVSFLLISANEERCNKENPSLISMSGEILDFCMKTHGELTVTDVQTAVQTADA